MGPRQLSLSIQAISLSARPVLQYYLTKGAGKRSTVSVIVFLQRWFRSSLAGSVRRVGFPPRFVLLVHSTLARLAQSSFVQFRDTLLYLGSGSSCSMVWWSIAGEQIDTWRARTFVTTLVYCTITSLYSCLVLSEVINKQQSSSEFSSSSLVLSFDELQSATRKSCIVWSLSKIVQ